MKISLKGGLLESKDQRRSFLMGQRFTLSFSDIKMANHAYSCDGKPIILMLLNIKYYKLVFKNKFN
jgi:hypothetical protein